MIYGSLDVWPEGRTVSVTSSRTLHSKNDTSYYFILIYVTLENYVEFNGCVGG